MQQTGQSAQDRKAFLRDFHGQARASLIQIWEPEEKDRRYF